MDSINMKHKVTFHRQLPLKVHKYQIQYTLCIIHHAYEFISGVFIISHSVTISAGGGRVVGPRVIGLKPGAAATWSRAPFPTSLVTPANLNASLKI